MNGKQIRVAVVSVLIVLPLVWAVGKRMSSRPAEAEPSAFAQAVDLSPLDTIAVYREGRLKSYGSFANQMLGFIAGPHKVLGQPDPFSYLDIMIRPNRYVDQDIVHIKQEPMRVQLARTLDGADGFTPARREHFIDTGLISPRLLMDPGVQEQLRMWSGDLIKTAKHSDRVVSALDALRAERDPVSGAVTIAPQQVLSGALRVVPPGTGDLNSPWRSLSVLFPASSGGMSALDGLDASEVAKVRGAWEQLVSAWRAEDAQKVNEAVAVLGSELPLLKPEIYPSQTKMGWESWYFASGHMTWVWLVYLLSLIFLLGGVVYRWVAARWIGIAIFGVAFGLHTFALGLRWYVSGRWPNSNMFEAVTTAVWFGALLAIILELWAGKTALRNLFALTGAAASMVAMMAAHFLPELDANISNRMPILYDIWLYIHTNVIIASYALIAMASVTGVLYLLWRLGGGGMDYAKVGGAASLIEVGRKSAASRTMSKGEIFDGATMILMELAVILLWAGIVMGAIWADHSWGRPWGWDPKEVFAFNTLVIFLILVHMRLTAKDKGLWTAWLAVLGCAVMLFNWIVINFVISGLHSYA